MQMHGGVIRRKIMRTRTWTVLQATLVVAVLMGCGSVVRAQGSVGIFNIDFNANPGILATDGSATAFMSAGWNTQSALTVDFNSVALRVFNDANSTTNLTQLALTIGDVRFNFANFFQTNNLLLPPNNTYIAAGAVATNDLIIPLDNVSAIATTIGPNPSQVAAGADNADRVVIDFGNGGIKPGYSALFELRFEYDDAIPMENRPTSEPLLGINNSMFPQHFPSYQRILFDTNAPNLPFFSDLIDLVDLSDNAAVTVTFANGEQSVPQSLPDQFSVALTSFVDPSHPMPYFITPQASGSIGIIPEPATLVLFLAGLTGLASLRRASCLMSRQSVQ